MRAWLKRPELAFATRFVAVSVPLSALYAYPRGDGAVHAAIHDYLALYARVAGAVIAWFDPSARVVDTQIFGRFALSIVMNCDAMDVQILLFSAILALPVRLGLRLLGGVVGFLLVSLANVTRIVSLYFIGVHAPSEFEPAHREWWPLALVLWALGAFLMFVRRTRDAAAASSLRKLP